MSLHLLIFGRVQGVFFRASTHKIAQSLGLKGWVKNKPDGSVEVFASDPLYYSQGSTKKSEKLLDFYEWCRHGPKLANVTRIEITWESSEERYDDFTIQYEH